MPKSFPPTREEEGRDVGEKTSLGRGREEKEFQPPEALLLTLGDVTCLSFSSLSPHSRTGLCPNLSSTLPTPLFHSLPLELKQDFAKRSPSRGTLRTTSSLDGQVQFYPGTPGGGGRPESGGLGLMDGLALDPSAGQAPEPLPSLWAGAGALWNSWTLLGSSLLARLRLPGPCRMPPTDRVEGTSGPPPPTPQRLGEKSAWPQPAGAPALPLPPPKLQGN